MSGDRKSKHPEQAAAVPFRLRKGNVEFCLVTTAGGRRWTIPKGFIDAGETAVDTALKEAREEAGLEGRVVGDPLGTYDYEKWGGRLLVEVYLMEVANVAKVWEEMGVRERRWVGAAEAIGLMTSHPARGMLEQAVTRLDGPGPGRLSRRRRR